MKKLILPFAFLSLFAISSNAQKKLFLNASVLSQPDEFHFRLPHPNPSKFPGFTLNAGYTSDIKASNFIWEGQLSYMNVTAEWYEDDFVAQDPNDPAIPDKLNGQYVSNIVGLKTGIGYEVSSESEKHSVAIIIGATGYLPFLSKTKGKMDDGDWNKSPMHTGDSFKHGILYGFYLKPTYQLTFGKNSPWALNIFGEANLLWRNAVENGTPLFMAGGGMGVSYTLN